MAKIDVTPCGGTALDALRGLLSGLSNRGEYGCAPVSIVSLQHELRRRNADTDIVDALYLLSDIRDVQHVGRGFWLPAPPHLVPFEGFSLLVAGLPNQELSRLYGYAPMSSGASRLLKEGIQNLELPRGGMRDWLSAPPSTIEWTLEKIRGACSIEPISLDGAELFRAWRGGRSPRWAALDHRALLRDGTLLIRFSTADRHVNHYLVHMKAQHIVGMSELTHDSDEVRRLQFGLRVLHDDPGVFWFERTESCDVVLNSPPLPRQEQRLFTALGSIDKGTDPPRWHLKFPDFAQAALVNTLRGLGLKDRGSSS